MPTIEEILRAAKEAGASDVHLLREQVMYI